MNTFHVSPDYPNRELVEEAAAEIQAQNFAPDTLIAVRGADIDSSEYLYTVSPCPNQNDVSSYMWQYVTAESWLSAFAESCNSVNQ